MKDDRIVQQPTQPQQLVLPFHGVGSNASDLLPLTQALAPHVPGALTVSVQAPDAQGSGRQWLGAIVDHMRTHAPCVLTPGTAPTPA